MMEAEKDMKEKGVQREEAQDQRTWRMKEKGVQREEAQDQRT